MDWKLQFISQENLIRHVKATIDKYGEKLESFDIVRFNKNIIDPVKMIFDKTVYQSSWEEIIGNEIFRQRYWIFPSENISIYLRLSCSGQWNRRRLGCCV